MLSSIHLVPSRPHGFQAWHASTLKLAFTLSEARMTVPRSYTDCVLTDQRGTVTKRVTRPAHAMRAQRSLRLLVPRIYPSQHISN